MDAVTEAHFSSFFFLNYKCVYQADAEINKIFEK